MTESLEACFDSKNFQDLNFVVIVAAAAVVAVVVENQKRTV